MNSKRAGPGSPTLNGCPSRGPSWYWNNFTISEHTGTHFDAPIHWVTGKDYKDGAVDTIDPKRFFAPVCVVDCTAEVKANPDFILSKDFLIGWEAQHGFAQSL